MVETNLALRQQVAEPSADWQQVVIGNSQFTDDVWDLRPYITSETEIDCHKQLSFAYISNSAIKHTVKQYAYYKLGKVKPKTVRIIVNGSLPSCIEFCRSNGISSFAHLTQELFLSYNL